MGHLSNALNLLKAKRGFEAFCWFLSAPTLRQLALRQGGTCLIATWELKDEFRLLPTVTA